MPIPFSSSASPRQAYLPTSPRHSIPKALRICFLNSKLQEKSVQKRKAGSNCSLIRKLSMKKPSKPTATSAEEYKECLPHLVLRLKRKLITNNFQKLILPFHFLSASWSPQTERKFLSRTLHRNFSIDIDKNRTSCYNM